MQSKTIPNDISQIGNDKFNVPQPGQTIDGEVTEVGKKGIFIDLAGFGTGTILGREIKNNPQMVKSLKIGDKITAVVLEYDNENGLVELSFGQARKEKSWEVLEEKQRSGELIKVKITQANRGGLIADFEGISGFLPVSQLAEQNYPRVEDGNKSKILQSLNQLVGKEMEVVVLDADQREQKLIVSEKAKNREELEKLTANYQPGQIVDGEITGVVDFGAFIKFGEPVIEGLIHISEIDWQIIKHPSDVLKVGDKIQAKILGIQNGQIALSLKALKIDPWENVENEFKKGDEIKGEVTKFNAFGAFVKLTPLIQGLVHISEFGTQDKMKEMLEIGKTYQFNVLFIDSKKHRLSLKLADAQK